MYPHVQVHLLQEKITLSRPITSLRSIWVVNQNNRRERILCVYLLCEKDAEVENVQYIAQSCYQYLASLLSVTVTFHGVIPHTPFGNHAKINTLNTTELTGDSIRGKSNPGSGVRYRRVAQQGLFLPRHYTAKMVSTVTSCHPSFVPHSNSSRDKWTSLMRGPALPVGHSDWL